MASELITELNINTFDSTIKGSTQVILVDFWAPWCGPCKAIAPILEQVATELSGKVKICKVNVDEASELANRYSIRAIPTLLIFKNGAVAEQLVGMVDKNQLKTKLKTHTG